MSQDRSLLDLLISVTAFFARLGHLLEAEVSVRVVILSVTGDQRRSLKGRAESISLHSQLALISKK